MALTRVTKIGDGMTSVFNVNFTLGYISEAHVTAWVNGEVDGLGDPVYRTITFNSVDMLELSGDPPAPGVEVYFERTVPKDALLVDFSEGDNLNEENLDLLQLQVLMIVHEAIDGRIGPIASNFDMNGFRLRNLGAPVDDNDVATREYVLSNSEGGGAGGDAGAIAGAAAAAAAIASFVAVRANIGNGIISADQITGDTGEKTALLNKIGGQPAAAELSRVGAVGASVASAATVALDGVGHLIPISGSVTITKFSIEAGHVRWVKFLGNPIITNNANIILQGTNRTAQTNEYALVIAEGTDVVRIPLFLDLDGVSPEVAAAIAAAVAGTTLLGGQNSAYYRNSSNQNAGTLPDARLSAAMQSLLTLEADDVYSYMFAKRLSNVNMAMNDTTAGSNLVATNSDDAAHVGPTLNGIYRLHGDINGGSGDINVSLFRRIS